MRKFLVEFLSINFVEGEKMAKKFRGRPRKCDNEPGSGACKKMKKKNSSTCRNCNAKW